MERGWYDDVVESDDADNGARRGRLWRLLVCRLDMPRLVLRVSSSRRIPLVLVKCVQQINQNTGQNGGFVVVLFYSYVENDGSCRYYEKRVGIILTRLHLWSLAPHQHFCEYRRPPKRLDPAPARTQPIQATTTPTSHNNAMNLSISLPCISTPQPRDDDVHKQHHASSTPSPSAVNEFHSGTTVNSANCSDVVSDLISDHLVTEYMSCSDGNDDSGGVGSSAVSLPELMEGSNDGDQNDASHKSDNGPAEDSQQQQTTTTRSSSSLSSPSRSRIHATYSAATAFQTTLATTSSPHLHLGSERTVHFHTESLGIKLSRCADGHVRILSIAPYRPMGNETVREGELYEGDVVREVSGVDLRMGIDSAVWKLTVGLIKMAPRPLRVVVASELEEEIVEEEEVADEVKVACNGNVQNAPAEADTANNETNATCKNANKEEDNATLLNLGPKRQIHYFESSLGVKLQHTPEGYVKVHSVTPISNTQPSLPLTRTGNIQEGDMVLEVGGVWDLYYPISIHAWGILVKFIRETRRPLCMVVAEDLGSLCPPSLDRLLESDEESSVEEDEENGEAGDEKNASNADVSVGNDDACDETEPEPNTVQEDVDTQDPEESEKSSPQEHELQAETPEICRVLNQQLSFDALQKELNKAS